MNIGHYNEFKRNESRKKAERADRIAFRVACAGLAILLILNLMGV